MGLLTTVKPPAPRGWYDFEGLIDEVRIWNRARSGSEILQTMNHRLVGDEPGLAGYWRFDEGDGMTAKDQTSNGSHGTLSGGGVSWVSSDAPIGKHPGMQRTSFTLGDRQADTGLAARLFYQQEKQSAAAGDKSVKQNARVLLTAVTTGSEPLKKYVAAVDVGVSREGKLAQLPKTIPLPALFSTNQSNSGDVVLQEIANLEADIPRLNTEVTSLTAEIETLNNEIKPLEIKEAMIPTVERDVSDLQGQLDYLNRPRIAQFFAEPGGSLTSLATGTEKNDLGDWNDRIGYITLQEGVMVWLYPNTNFQGNGSLHEALYDGYSFFTPKTTSSIKVKDSPTWLGKRTVTQAKLNSKQTTLNQLKNERDNQLIPKRSLRSQKNNLISNKQTELSTKNAKLTELRQVRIGTPPSQPMRQFHTDPRGLTASSGLLGFAYSDSQPTLFDSALGRMALYFKGLNKQFFSAYYDVNTSRAKWSLVAGSGSLTRMALT